MERIVEHTHLWCGGHECIYGTQATQMTRIVYGSQVAQALDSVFYVLIYNHAILEQVTALHDTMAYGINLV